MCCLSVFCCTSKNRASDATASTGADEEEESAEEEEESAEEEESDMFGCVWFVFDFNRLHVQEKKTTDKQTKRE